MFCEEQGTTVCLDKLCLHAELTLLNNQRQARCCFKEL